jgi:hypothetical protein
MEFSIEIDHNIVIVIKILSYLLFFNIKSYDKQ